MEGVLEGLAQAAQILSSGDASAVDRAGAEAAFDQLKTGEYPLEAFGVVLEAAAHPDAPDDNLLFHTATVLKAAVAQQARGIGSDDVLALVRGYLLQFLTDRPGVFRAARGQLLACIAVLIKREWTLSKDTAAQALREVMDALEKGDLATQMLGLGVLRSVLAEFSSNSRSTATGMTLEDHMVVKHSFETTQLQAVLQTAAVVFHSVVGAPGVQRDAPLRVQVGLEVLLLVQTAVELAEAVLSWQFSTHRSRRMIGTLDQEASIYFRGDATWREVVNPELILLFLTHYGLVRDLEDCAHPLRQLMIQLVAVGSIFQGSSDGGEYLATAVGGVVNVVSTYVLSGDATADELLAWATMLDRLVSSFGFDAIVSSAGHDGAVELLQAAQSLLSEAFGQMAAGSLDDGGQDGEGCASETVNAVLQAWVSMITAESFQSQPAWAEGAALPFTAYVEARVVKAARDAVDDAEVQEETEPDEVLYEAQLTAVAAVGRFRAAEAVAGVGSQLEEKAAKLAELVVMAVDVDEVTLAIASEELHWMVLVAGFLLCDSDVGDRNIVPVPIMALSADAASADEDTVTQLAMTVLELLSSIIDVADQGAAHRISPVILGDLLWWLARWARAYLLLREELYEDGISLSLITSFGEGSEGAAAVAESLLTSVCKILLVWHGDPAVVARCVGLIDVLTERRPVQSLLLKGEVVWTLAEGFRDAGSGVGQLPAELQTHIAKALCRLCSAAGEADRTRLFEHIMAPTHSNFTAALEQPGFGPELAQTLPVKTCVHRTLYVLRGVAQSVSEVTAPLFFGYFRDMLESVVLLFSIYTNAPETCALVLELLVDLITNVADRLGAEGHGVLCATALATVHAHLPNMQRLREGPTAQQQAEFGEHALLMVQLLAATASAQQFGGEVGSDGGRADAAGPSDVVIAGLEQLIPMLNEDYLSEPQLCQRFFSLILYLAQEFSAQLYANGALSEMVLTTIAHGIGPYGTDITRSGLESLHYVGATHFEQLQQGCANPALGDSVRELLESLLQMFLLEPFDLRLEQSAARALFPLICIDEEYFRHLAEALLARQTTPDLRDRFAEALHGLLSAGGLCLQVDRQNQSTFTANFKELLSAVRGFILTH